MSAPKRFLFYFFILFPFCLSGQNRGELISESLLMTLDKTDIEEIYAEFELPDFLFPIDYDSLELYKIVYWTIDAHGNDLIEASGLVTIPVGYDCEFPLLNFNHGTFTYDQSLSGLDAGLNQHFVGVPFTANGYVSVLPDFLGYGETPLDHPHPYIHAKSEATAVVDMLRAVREFCDLYEVVLNDQLFLVGYSHGGHVTMATHRELEAFYSDEFTVTASAPCAGAYDLSGIMLDSMLYSDDFSNPLYIAFSTLSYQFVYGDLYENISEAFIPPYDSIIPLLFDREDPQIFWNDSLPKPGYLILQPDYLDELKTNPSHPVRLALQDNNVYDWLPEAPMRLYHCDGDDNIPYVNTIFTAEHMLALGAYDLEAINVGDLNHVECSSPSVILAKLWFDDMREECSPALVAEPELEEQLTLYPNPFTETFYIDLNGLELLSETEIYVFDLLGRQVYESRPNVFGQIPVQLPDLPAGTYIVRLKWRDQQVSKKILKHAN